MIELKSISPNDGEEYYNMLQRIGRSENEFQNTANGLTKEEFSDWLQIQNMWSRGECLPDGFVPQTVFWLVVNGVPTGIGKIRHALNEHSRAIGGNLGYAIDPLYRGKGYATILLTKLVEMAHTMEIGEILLTVEKYNPASRRVIEKCGGIMLGENSARWYFTFK